jgi:hypothetical protein
LEKYVTLSRLDFSPGICGEPFAFFMSGDGKDGKDDTGNVLWNA